ncbi:MAG: acyltransferase family protein [Micromonosporaceae bacterium]
MGERGGARGSFVTTLRTAWPTLEHRYSTRANGFGALRLLLATTVLVAHALPLGPGWPNLGYLESRTQADAGTVAVLGFFVVSGFLITGSGLKFSGPRFVWHRALRILPAYWVCLVVTAFAFAPIAALRERGTLAGLWTHPLSPQRYVLANAFVNVGQGSIGGLLADNPFARIVPGPGAFNGSLWTLAYELACYGLVAALAATLVLRRAPRAVLLLAALGFLVLLNDFVHADGWVTHPAWHGTLGPLPLFGALSGRHLLYLGFAFLLGSAAYLYRDRLPMHGALAAVAGVGLTTCWLFGGFWAFGLPLLAYVVLYAAVAVPGRVQAVGRHRDYSYGIYVYAFPVSQLAALFGVARYGFPVYLAVVLAITVALAALSWHLVEERCLRLKDWSPRWWARRVRRAARAAPASVPETAATHGAVGAESRRVPRPREPMAPAPR